jgi:hypothetical protein
MSIMICGRFWFGEVKGYPNMMTILTPMLIGPILLLIIYLKRFMIPTVDSRQEWKNETIIITGMKRNEMIYI